MKIGIDVRVLGQNEYGGVNEYIKNIIPLMIKNKEHFFYLFYSSFRNKNIDIENILEIQNSRNVKIYKFKYPNKILFFTSYFNFLKFDKMMKINDLDLFFSPHILPVSLTKNIPLVILFHDVSFINFPHFFDIKRRLWHFLVQPKKQAEKANFIITPSKYIKHEIIELYKINPSIIKAIPLGVKNYKNNNNYYNKQELKKVYSIPDKYILSLSTLEPRKNIPNLIRAFDIACQDKTMKDMHLVIAGGVGWKYKNIIKEYEKSTFKSKIVITGAIDEKYKESIYKNAILFIFPSFYEGFGLPPLEAMSQGIPVISSFAGSLPEVVGGSAMLVDPHNISLIAKSIIEVVSTKQLQKEMKKASLDRAKNFSWDQTEQKTTKFLEHIVEK